MYGQADKIMILKSRYILYVENQAKSTGLYSQLLGFEPALNVPGMTEFKLSDTAILGLMPKKGIAKLLDNKYSVLESKEDLISTEIYFEVESLDPYYQKVKNLGMKIISEIKVQDWGHKTFYTKDEDGNVIAFATNEKIKR